MTTYKVRGWIKTEKGIERYIAGGFDSVAEAARWIVSQVKLVWVELNIMEEEK
jgi:hypothetical protein